MIRWIPIVFSWVGACHEAPAHDAARVAIPPASAASTTAASAPPQHWTPAAKQPTTDAELAAFTGHWRVTGSDLKLHAYEDGIILKFDVEADTARYRKGDIRFELDMALNGTGFTTHDHARVDPGDKVYDERGLDSCSDVSSTLPVSLGADHLAAVVVDADTLRVQRIVWKATFETDAEGHIVRCTNMHVIDAPWDELRRVNAQ